MKPLQWPKVGAIALQEAGAILKSPGFILAALAPFFIVLIGGAALFYFSSKDLRKAIVITGPDSDLVEMVAKKLSEDIGPEANKSKLRDANAAHWHPIAMDETDTTDAATSHVKLPIGMIVTITESGPNTIDIRHSPPPYLLDITKLAVSAARFEQATGDSIVYEVMTPDRPDEPTKSLDQQLIWLLTVILATSAGALAAASTHALTTAFLERPSESYTGSVHLREDFMGKLIGIGCAYSTLALPWGLILAAGLGVLTMTGEAELVEAIRTVTISGLDPMRLTLFLLCAPAGYVLFASLALIMAMRSKTAASARSFTGPLSFLAIAPAPLALAFSANMEGGTFSALSWFPLTATASIQLGFGTLNTYDLLIRALFLCFIALATLQWGMRRRELLSVD